MRPTTVTGQEQEPRPGWATQVAARTATAPEPQRMHSFPCTPEPALSPSAAHTAPSVPTAGTPVAAAPRCPWPHLSPPYGLTMDCPLRLDTRLGTSPATEPGPESAGGGPYAHPSRAWSGIPSGLLPSLSLGCYRHRRTPLPEGQLCEAQRTPEPSGSPWNNAQTLPQRPRPRRD